MRWFYWMLLVTACAWPAQAATINAASGSRDDVNTALGLAAAGDRVVIPAGSNNWTSGITWTALDGVIIQGAGTSATGGGDQTIIVDNIASDSRLLAISIATNKVLRITGITFRSGTGALKDGGTIRIDGPGALRMDHSHLLMTSSANYKAMVLSSGLSGVIDHSILDFTSLNALYIVNGRLGSSDSQGNLEWSLPTDFGGTNYFYIEDNQINGSTGGTAYDTRIFDGFTAAKVVVRFNTVVSACLAETHATGHSSDDRGLRSQEIYGNLVTSTLAKDPNYAMVNIGNGTSLVWGNSMNNVYKNIYTIYVTRANNDTYNQAATPTGWGYAGTTFNGTGSMWDGGTVYGTNTATGYPCIDQPGRGQGDLLTGVFSSKVNSTTGTINWPNQALEPVYIWKNTGSIVSGWGGTTYANNAGGRVAANRDYYQQASGIQTSPTSPFNGTSGVGWGTLANRPTTCTPGVAYFATDVGSWNTSTTNDFGVQQNGADGLLYKCTTTDTWTLYYTPLIYPHPLVAVAAVNTSQLRGNFNLSGKLQIR